MLYSMPHTHFAYEHLLFLESIEMGSPMSSSEKQVPRLATVQVNGTSQT